MNTENTMQVVKTNEEIIENIKSRFFEVIKVPMVTEFNNVPQAIAMNEASILTAEILAENKRAIEENSDIEELNEEEVFNLTFKKCYKEALKKYSHVAIEGEEKETIKFSQPENMFGIYNASNGHLLSQKSMGKDFTPMQQQEFLDNILTTILDFDADLDIQTLTFNVYASGSKIEFRIKMHPISFKNDKDIDDITNIELVFSTSYDGSKSNRISLFTERLVCTNGMTALKLEGELKGRNTQGGKDKILSYTKEVAEIINGAEEFKAKMIALDKIKVSKKQVETFKKSLLGFNSETLKAEVKKAIKEGKKEPNQTRKLTILKNFDEALNIEFERTGETAFGLLQGATYYTNHLANTSKTISNDEYIRFFQGAKTNDKAQELVFAMLPKKLAA